MLDSLDKRVLQQLKEDGRRSNVEIAKVLGVSESTVRNRIKNLLSKDVAKIALVPNPYKLGYGFISVMGLQVTMAVLRQVAETLAQIPNVYYLSFVTGRYDMIAIVMFKSPEDLSNFIKERISAIPGIIRTETFVNLEVTKSPWRGTPDIVELVGATPDTEQR